MVQLLYTDIERHNAHRQRHTDGHAERPQYQYRSSTIG